MNQFKVAATCLSWIVLSSPVLSAGDLSRYREFRLDTNLVEVAKQAEMEPGQAKFIHQRPAAIQELSWRAEPADSVEKILFSFYNGELFRMVVDYDRHKTEGLMAGDLIHAISAIYGTELLLPSAELTLSSIYHDGEPVKVIARWEDSNWSFNLVRSKYLPTFALVALSKRLDDLAQAAIDEAVRLDREEAPQREIDRQHREDEKKLAQQEKARLVNKPGFRP